MNASYSIVRVAPGCVFIIDHDRGKSVTNDAEAVVSAVYARFPGRRIFYKDTMGQWDELVHRNGRFTGFAPIDKGIAVPRVDQPPIEL